MGHGCGRLVGRDAVVARKSEWGDAALAAAGCFAVPLVILLILLAVVLEFADSAVDAVLDP